MPVLAHAADSLRRAARAVLKKLECPEGHRVNNGIDHLPSVRIEDVVQIEGSGGDPAPHHGAPCHHGESAALRNRRCLQAEAEASKISS